MARHTGCPAAARRGGDVRVTALALGLHPRGGGRGRSLGRGERCGKSKRTPPRGVRRHVAGRRRAIRPTCRPAMDGLRKREADMSAPVPHPDPYNASRPFGMVPPGETPPCESSTGSGAGPYRPLSRGWGMAPLVLICLVALTCALFFLAYAIMLDL
ncbi:DUF6480 family protein [Streptomyces erythrochromogenes]|uniref:DUF6480 family protein n=1 Tax=Streptomyces erythrochromogenes TaxID=285574 RepID=UPI0036A21E07